MKMTSEVKLVVVEMGGVSWRTAEVSVWGDSDSDQFQKNERRAISAGLEPCQFCGRGVNIAAGKGFEVHPVFGGGLLLAADQWQHFDSYVYGELKNKFPEIANQITAGDLGYWVVGPECGKHIHKDFKRTGETA